MKSFMHAFGALSVLRHVWKSCVLHQSRRVPRQVRHLPRKKEDTTDKKPTKDETLEGRETHNWDKTSARVDKSGM